jgi:hypothetical protein
VVALVRLQIYAETLRVCHSPPVAAACIDPIEFPSTVASATARERESPHAPPPPSTGTAPERMRVKTPCSWRMKASPSKCSKTGGGKKRSRSESEGSAQESSLPTSPPHPNPAKEWKKSKLKTEDLLALVNSMFLWEKEMDVWRPVACDPYPIEKNPDEIRCSPDSWSRTSSSNP